MVLRRITESSKRSIVTIHYVLGQLSPRNASQPREFTVSVRDV